MALSRKAATKIYEIHAHTSKATCLDIGTTGRVLVTGGQDRAVNLWALGNSECFMALEGHTSSVEFVTFAYNDDYVYSADENGVIKQWNLNSAEESATYYGHMKSVRTIDFHPYGEYIVSGSNDTSLRLWDTRLTNCIKKYKSHISHVNSVRFSPDGSWIASAGNEGSIIIWDIRMSQQIVEFIEKSSPVTCIEYHPTEFLLAAGRADGTVDFYDLEKNKLISTTDYSSTLHGQPIKCITFSETKPCLFAGTSNKVSLIGWEPDRIFDHFEGVWSNLGDMKELNNKNQLYCAGFDNEMVSIHAMNLELVMPFFNPSNKPFSHNQGSRKSFSNRTGKLKLSIGAVPSNVDENGSYNKEGGAQSPNLSFEMIDEEDTFAKSLGNALAKSDPLKNNTMNYAIPYQIEKYISSQSSTKYSSIDEYPSDLDMYPTRSSPGLSHIVEPEREDFPVNNAQQPDYAPKLQTMSIKTVTTRQKVDLQQKRNSSLIKTNTQSIKKMTASISSTDIHKMDDNTALIRKPISRGGSPIRNNFLNQSKIKKSESSTQFHKERENNNIKTKDLTVHIYTKPPVRSKTAIDIKATAGSVASSQRISHYDLTNEVHEIELMSTCHESVYQALRNRHTSIQIVRSIRPQDLTGIIRNAVQMKDHSVLVDILGVIIENAIPLNLDICVVLLPEIYDLLKSEYVFHSKRACDTLRTVLTTFLPTIRENIDYWGGSLGVDITHEERRKKCLNCKQWLLRIRTLPENPQLGNTLTQLQNMITDL